MNEMLFFKKVCEPLTPSFKVRILITSKASNKVIGTRSKSLILVTGDVLITGL